MPHADRLPARLLLVGMMGSGKSTIGRALAARTGWPYVDNDELLERVTGTTARELLSAGGEAALRAGESAMVDHALRLPPPAIVGIAAGVVLDPAARDALREAGDVIWLRARPETLAGRLAGLGGRDHRPFLEGDALGWVEREAARRAPLYESVASRIVDVDGRTPDEIAQEILRGPAPPS